MWPRPSEGAGAAWRWTRHTFGYAPATLEDGSPVPTSELEVVMCDCAWPDCHAHARWCHIHHLNWWHRDRGVTSVENGALRTCTRSRSRARP